MNRAQGDWGRRRQHTQSKKVAILREFAPKFIDVDARANWQTSSGVTAKYTEMIALEWRDIDLAKRQICVQRSDWNGQATTPKGGRLRYVPLTLRLAATFRDHRHRRSPTCCARKTASR